MMRKLVGAILMTLGIVGLVIDYDGIRVAHGGALHAINAGVEIFLIFAGLVALLPTLATEIARQLPLFGKAVTAALPGGRRDSDPPA